MAEQKEYNIPLRKEFQKVPKYKRAKKAITAIKQFLTRHLKKEDVKIGPELNEEIWERGIKNPPHHVKVNAYVEKDTIYAEKLGVTFKKVVKQEKKKETPKDKLMEKLKLKDKPKQEKKSDKKETTQNKKEEKPEIKKDEKVNKTENKKSEEKIEEKTESKKLEKSETKEKKPLKEDSKKE